MGSKWVTLEEGIEDLIPERKRYDELGFYPRRYWLIGEVDEDETAGHVDVHIDELARPRTHNCKRCNREIQPRFEYCYHCYNYVQKKARIAREMEIEACPF